MRAGGDYPWGGLPACVQPPRRDCTRCISRGVVVHSCWDTSSRGAKSWAMQGAGGRAEVNVVLLKESLSSSSSSSSYSGYGGGGNSRDRSSSTEG